MDAAPSSPRSRGRREPPETTETIAIAPVITPAGALRVERADDAPPIAAAIATRVLDAFADGAGLGLLQLGAAEVGVALSPALAFWRAFAARFVAEVCALREPAPPCPPIAELDALVAAAPPMLGGEYLRGDQLAIAWRELGDALAEQILETDGSIETYLHAQHAAWNLVGRVHFNLAENRADDAAPFAFLATYTTRLTAGGKAQHAPLGQALREYAGDANKQRMLALLEPMQRATATCDWLAALVKTGEVFHPLRWSIAEARALLDDVPKLEAAGVVVRVPGAWHGGRPARPQVTATVGSKPPAGIGGDALLDFAVDVTLDGTRLTRAEIDALLAAGEGLRLVRGQWVEIDRAKLGAMLDRFRAAARAAADGMGFAQAMRALAGGDPAHADALADADWTRVTAGPWLADTLAGLRDPARLAALAPGDDLRATLRPYQHVGLRWLHLLVALGLGACLADDMGLGKTVQVIALLVVLKREARATKAAGAHRPSVLVAPASLLGNWSAELARFAPSLSIVVAHPSATGAPALGDAAAPSLAGVDLVITSYGTLARTRWLRAAAWRVAILDEAQAIKNPGAQQTKAVKQLDATARLALTGTPVENRLGDLWSLFDFLSPGLLGTGKEFTAFTRTLAADPERGFTPLRTLVAPYILRRLKSDRTVIADLPDKSEVVAYCGLSRAQVALYQRAVDELATKLRTSKSIERRGVVLAALVRMKQICNHPAHWQGDGGDAWPEADSGKLVRLRELAEVIAAKQDKVLVFSQFREACAPLAAFLAGVFGRAGLVLHGAIAVGKRAAMVRQFQDDDRVPFFVLSLKAGGTGLNLTAASHVIHFDRWWNPAVEDQATDRAYRIGQHRNVLVHKFVCRGTVEDKIDAMITGKRALARDLLDAKGGDELKLTELSDRELIDLVQLDLKTAQQER